MKTERKAPARGHNRKPKPASRLTVVDAKLATKGPPKIRPRKSMPKNPPACTCGAFTGLRSDHEAECAAAYWRPRVGAKQVGYTNPGGDASKLAPVYALTKEERRRKGEVKTLSYVIKAGERAEAKLEALCGKCDHRVFEDTAGVPYDLRYCVICGASCGVI